MSLCRAAVVTILTLCSAAAFAQGAQMRPGLWEISMTGMPTKQNLCITPDMAKDVTKLGKDQRMPESDCKTSTPQVSGNSTSFSISCTKPSKFNSHMTLTSNGPDSFSMMQKYDMDVGGQRHQGSMTTTYKRIGDCKK